MNRLLIIALGALAGVLTFFALQGRPAQADTLTVLGEVAPGGLPEGAVPLTFTFSDRASGRVVYRGEAKAEVRDGKYVADLRGSGLPTDGLYAVQVSDGGGTQVASTFVNLQTTTPGTAQTGNVNITGTIRAGRAIVTSALNPTLEVRSTSTAANANTALFEANAASGRGLLAIARGGTGIAGVFQAKGNGGVAGSFTAEGSLSTAVVGRATATSGPTIGGDFSASGIDGTGLRGTAPRVGVYGRTTESNFAATTGDAVGNSSYGVYGVVTGASSDMRAVVGSAPTGNGNLAVYAIGDTGATGTKSFLIDHPLDPENKDLIHYSAEGPEPLLVYQGNATLGSDGSAWIQLPGYWSSVNRDPRYQFAPIGAPMPNLYVATEVQNNRFRIAGGRPGGRVSWTVSAVRNDRRMRMFPAPVEVEKPAFMRGFYRAPEMFGFGPERGEMGAKEALARAAGAGGNGGTP